MKKIIFAAVVFCTLSVLSSCSKTSKKSGTFTMTGTIVYSSDRSIPVTNLPFDVRFNARSSPVSTKDPFTTIIGSGITDSLGYFVVICDFYSQWGGYEMVFPPSDLYMNSTSVSLSHFQPQRDKIIDAGVIQY